MAKGIDYGMGQANVDRETGIRYGVIPVNALGYDMIGEFESNYTPRCPECGDDVKEDDSDNFVCATHGEQEHDACFGDEPDSNTYEKDGYSLMLDEHNDVWVLKSPHYTRAAFCSPCAPGACYLTSPCEDGEKAYCLGADWFDSDNPIPYVAHDVA